MLCNAILGTSWYCVGYKCLFPDIKYYDLVVKTISICITFTIVSRLISPCRLCLLFTKQSIIYNILVCEVTY